MAQGLLSVHARRPDHDPDALPLRRGGLQHAHRWLGADVPGAPEHGRSDAVRDLAGTAPRHSQTELRPRPARALRRLVRQVREGGEAGRRDRNDGRPLRSERPTDLTPAEWKRKAVHAGIGLFALTLRWLDWRIAALAAVLAVVFNAVVIPRIGRGLYRDPSARQDAGIVAYPAMVALLILVFAGKHIPIAAAVWAMMAFGDPAASIAGKLVGGPKLPWNPGKTWVGLLSNWAVGGAAAILLFLFVSRREIQPDSVAILVAGAAIYAFLESVRAGVDDNIVAALPTALAVYQMSLVFPPPFLRLGEIPPAHWLTAVAVNAAAAGIMGALGVVSRSGAVAGGIAGFLILAFGGWAAYGLLWAFFLAGTIATRLGYRRKASLGVAQADTGRRGVAHVVANCAV